MSKFVKQLEMTQLKREFEGHENVLVVNVIGLSGTVSNQLRLDLRKKGISMRVVKNTLARHVLSDLGIKGVDSLLQGTTAIAWGGPGIAELAKEISAWAAKLQKFEIKGGSVSGQTVDAKGVKLLSELPSREELIGRVAAMIMAPAGRVVMLAMSPARNIASQLKTIYEKAESAPGEAGAAAAEPSTATAEPSA